jgi:hypothetical protein
MKTIGIIIVILALIMGIPPLRQKAGAVAMPVLEKLGPVGDVIVNPIKKMSSRSKVKHIASLLDADLAADKKVPTEREFQPWLQRRLPDDKGNDGWGQPIWITHTDKKITVVSNGPDQKPGTADDLTAEALK